MKLNYCICGKNTKHTFSTFFLFFGVIIYVSVLVFTIDDMLQYQSYFWPVFAVVLMAVGIWSGIDYYSQALYLGHNPRCARRYSILAALAQFKGHVEEYGNLGHYKSVGYRLLHRYIRKKYPIEEIVTIGMWISILAGVVTIKYPQVGFIGIVLAIATGLASLKVKDTKDYVVWRKRAVLLMIILLCVLALA